MSDKCKSLDLVHVGLCGSDGISLAICAEKLERVRGERGPEPHPHLPPQGTSPSGGETLPRRPD